MKLFLVDGSGLLHRAFWTYPKMFGPNGEPVNAVYGVADMAWTLFDKFKKEGATHIAVVFDTSGKNFRHELYPEYKANRKPVDPDLKDQFEGVRDAIRALNVPVIDAKGIEADDVLSSYAIKAEKLGYAVIIVSSDKDLQMLITSGHSDFGITVYDPMKQKFIGRKEVFDQWGVSPYQIADLLALAGDSADNVPGCVGVGVKTAAKLIMQFGTLENLLGNLSQVDKPKLMKSLSDNKEIIILSKKLVTLNKEVELEFSIEELSVRKENPAMLYSFLDRMKFSGLLSRLENEAFHA
jgi:DNA polymerase-1